MTESIRRRSLGRSIRPNLKRKNLNIDQTKLDRVVELLGVSTETEAVDQALEMLLFREELIAGVAAIGGLGAIENFFDEPRVP
jgi:Arc/MetJ family transcription regulator